MSYFECKDCGGIPGVTGCNCANTAAPEDVMTIRDEFAKAAPPACIGDTVCNVNWQEDAAWLAYSMADAMLRERMRE